MVVGFRRTISFPAPKSAAAGSSNGKSEAYRVRSASLPCRFHPLVLQLDDDVAALRGIMAGLASGASAGSVAGGAAQLGRVLVSLSELLHHPQAQEPLRRLGGRSPFAEQLLDDFLRLADSHGSFRAALVALAALQAEASTALRREDPARLASAARALRRSGRDLPRIASSARAVAAKAPPPPPAGLPADAAALAAAVADATSAIASASAAVFSGVSSLSIAAATARIDVATTPCWMASPARFATASATPRTSHHIITTKPLLLRRWWVADLMRWMSRAKRRSAKKHHAAVDASADCAASVAQPQPGAIVDPEERELKAAFERLDSLERCIVDVESSGEKVFRALVNTRVSLLNILTPSF